MLKAKSIQNRACDLVRLYGQLRKWKYLLALALTHDHGRTRPDNTCELKLTDNCSFFLGCNEHVLVNLLARQMASQQVVRYLGSPEDPETVRVAH